MPAKRKALSVAGVLAAGLLTIYACNSTSTTVSGQLSIVTLEGTSAGIETLGDIPLSSIRLPKKISLDPGISMAKPLLGTEPEFVPDEIIVQYRPGVEPLAVQGLAQAGGYRELRVSPAVQVLRTVYEGQGTGEGHGLDPNSLDFVPQPREVTLGAMAVLRLPSRDSERLSPAALKDRTLREIDRLNSLPSVEFAQPNYIYRPTALPDDNFYALQWHYPLIKLDQVWSESLVSSLQSVTVAVIDTGIARSNGTKSGSNHVDLGGSGTSPFVDEYDFISTTNRSLDGDGYDADATDPGDNPNPDLASFHGTHVMGTIGAFTGNAIGVAGIAGGVDADSSVRIMPLRALGYGGGTTADIVNAIKYAADEPNSTGKRPLSGQADIINLSLGSTTNDQALKNAVDAAYAKGVLIIAAAGNNGTPETFYPAGYDSAISVSAVDIGAEIASYSNFGGTIEVAAPGGSFSFDLNFDNYVDGVLSTFSEKLGTSSYKMDLFAFQQGTSMAAPHVAGLAALIKANNPSFNAAQIRSRIQGTVIDLGSAGRDDFYGYGMINAYKAVNGVAGLNPVLFPFPKKLKLMGNNPSGTFTLKNINDTNIISVTGITKEKNALWLDVSPTMGDADNNGLEITVSVDTSSYPQLKDGTTHTEMLNISSSAGVEHVYALYNVNGFPKTGIFDIGRIYVVALDIEKLQTDEYITHYDITSYGELYRFRVGALPSGTYIIGASTDRNNDRIIFESDDSYGFYLSIGQIISVEVNTGDNRTGIDFDVIEAVSNP